MSELGSGSGTSYPTSLDTDNVIEVNSPNASKTRARAECINDLAAAIVAIETELGAGPKGTAADVKTFLQTQHNLDGTHKSITTNTLSVTGQITSTVATGTAPLVVASTTEVANLKAATATLAVAATSIVYRGALVYHSGSNTLASGVSTPLSFNSESYDTSAIHDTVTNNSRLTVPSGVTKVRLSASFQMNTDTDYTKIGLAIWKNGGGFVGVPSTDVALPGGTATPAINVTSPILTVIAGDYFEAVAIQSNTSGNSDTTQVNGTWFMMELIA